MDYSDEIQPVFKCILRDGNWYYSLANQRMKLPERRDKIQRVPDLLKANRLLTAQEYTDIGYKHMVNEVHLVEQDGLVVPVARWISAKIVEDAGLGPELCELRRLVSDKDYHSFLVAAASQKAVSTGRYEHGPTVQPGQRKVQWGFVAKDGDARVVQITGLMAMLATKLIPLAFGSLDTTADMRNRNWHAKASLTFGDEDNQEISNLQLNISPPDDDLEGAIGDAGALHVDGNDWKGGYTVLISLSTLEEDYFPGRMSITSLKISCTMEIGSVLVFKGVIPHYPQGAGKYLKDVHPALRHKNTSSILSQSLPEGTPLKRIMAVGYPKKDIMNLDSRRINQAIRAENTRSVLRTKRNRAQWLMREDIKLNIAEIREHNCAKEHPDRVISADCPLSPDFWTHKYEWEETINSLTSTLYPRRSIAAKTLRFAGTTDPALNALTDAFSKLSCGAKFPNIKGEPKKATTKAGKVFWTHKNYESTFDPAVDTVPGNAGYDCEERKRMTRAQVTLAELLTRQTERRITERVAGDIARWTAKQDELSYRNQHQAFDLVACEVRETTCRRKRPEWPSVMISTKGASKLVEQQEAERLRAAEVIQTADRRCQTL